ncbi:MAG: 4-alpha-glucanotransferase [Oscillospiraceae bacterium]|nr:4-alpha-glucanotransferase [Oscillospiraceae bacterium]
MKRQSGVLLPVFSLPGKYGCGVFGEDAGKWIDFLSESGFSCWQVLPFGVTDGHDSPYMSLSSFGGNPFFLDPDALYKQGLVTEEELREQEVADPYVCRYEILKEKRLSFLKKAASRVSDRAPVEAFLAENPIIAGACRFLAASEKNDCKCSRDWTEEPDISDVFTWQFIQYEFHRQWKEIHEYAVKKGVSIIGDMPFYVSPNSYDVWASPEQFLLEKDGSPSMVAGVPPDYFSREGQKWGNPLYNWEEMEKDGFSWWKTRLGYMLSLFDGIRIDHFRAISSYWSVPSDAETAKSGKWNKGPGEKLVDALRSVSGEKLILAEDLGIIDDDTRALLKYSGFPGMAVFQFGFDGNPLSPHLPHNYRENLAAYTGTHDNNTLLGFFWELDENTRAEVMDYLGDPKDGCAAAIRALLMSRAGTVIFPVQDLLGYGADTRINVPGRAEGNWRYRMTEDQLNSLDRKRLKHLNTIYAR